VGKGKYLNFGMSNIDAFITELVSSASPVGQDFSRPQAVEDDCSPTAQGLTDDVDGQAEIAARLIGLPETDVKAAILKAAAARPRTSSRPFAQARFVPGRPPVVVERRAPHVLIR
jgi:hypothetical protein